MGKRLGIRNFTDDFIGGIRRRVAQGQSLADVANELGIALSAVYRHCEGIERPKVRMGRTPKLSEPQIRELCELRCQGRSLASLAKEFGVGEETVRRATHTLWRMRKRPQLVPSGLRLSDGEREEISRGISEGASARTIADRLQRQTSTVSREIKRAGGRGNYRAWHAAGLALQRRRRPKTAKLAANASLRALVETGLANYWSPEQISRQLRADYPDDSTMRVSHETIYQSLFVQGRGALRDELKKYLRVRRTTRKPKGSTRTGVGKIKDMVLISERPPEAEDRAVPGHWEGDLLIGRGGKSAIATLVERRSRYVMLVALPDGRTAPHVREALAAKIVTLPAELRKSLTWDQGKEMAHHAAFTIDTGVKVYFCEPHSPWQRGSNENTNGLLRQFLPKTADLRKVTQRELDRIADLMNGRPRETLNWMKPCDYFTRAVAMTG